MTPAGIIRTLGLKKPDTWSYRDTASYGHFGRDGFPWERVDKIEALLNEAEKYCGDECECECCHGEHAAAEKKAEKKAAPKAEKKAVKAEKKAEKKAEPAKEEIQKVAAPTADQFNGMLICPVCNERKLIMQENCVKCLACGHSKCG